jgi:uncharacterized membrane protein YfcA
MSLYISRLISNITINFLSMRPVFGYFAAASIGLSLGLIGGGGSILTVPVMV